MENDAFAAVEVDCEEAEILALLADEVPFRGSTFLGLRPDKPVKKYGESHLRTFRRPSLTSVGSVTIDYIDNYLL